MNRVGGCLRLLMLACAACVLGGCSVKSTFKGSGYYDTRGLPTSTLTGSVTDTASGTRFFAFSNFDNHSSVPKYIEATLSRPIWNRFAAVLEYNGNRHFLAGTHRAGITYQVPMPKALERDRLVLKYEPVGTNQRGGQVNLTGGVLFGPATYVEGFLDYDLKPHHLNTEWQVGRHLSGPLYGVVEYRFNRGVARGTGVGIGLEWKVR